MTHSISKLLIYCLSVTGGFANQIINQLKLLSTTSAFHENIDPWSALIAPPISEIDGTKTTVLRHFIRNGNGFGVVKVGVKIWNGSHLYLPFGTFAHMDLQTIPRDPQPIGLEQSASGIMG